MLTPFIKFQILILVNNTLGYYFKPIKLSTKLTLVIPLNKIAKQKYLKDDSKPKDMTQSFSRYFYDESVDDDRVIPSFKDLETGNQTYDTESNTKNNVERNIEIGDNRQNLNKMKHLSKLQPFYRTGKAISSIPNNYVILAIQKLRSIKKDKNTYPLQSSSTVSDNLLAMSTELSLNDNKILSFSDEIKSLAQESVLTHYKETESEEKCLEENIKAEKNATLYNNKQYLCEISDKLKKEKELDEFLEIASKIEFSSSSLLDYRYSEKEKLTKIISSKTGARSPSGKYCK